MRHMPFSIGVVRQRLKASFFHTADWMRHSPA
jgi:hypothetical protein